MKGQAVYPAAAALFAVAAASPSKTTCLLLIIYLLLLFIRRPHCFLPALVAALFFFVYFLIVDHHNKTSLSGGRHSLSVRFSAAPAIDGDRLQAAVQAGKERVQLRYIIRTAAEKEALRARLMPGVVCRLSGMLERPMPASNPYAFDYRRYLRRHRIHWLFLPEAIDLSACVRVRPTIIERLEAIREAGVRRIEAQFPPEAAGIAAALIYGERRSLDEEVISGYQQLGIIHLLAISGGHVTLLVGAALAAAIRFVTREAAVLALLVFLPMYAVLAGASPSVLRACATGMIVLAVQWKKGMIHPLDALSWTALALLVFDPYMVWDVGFQLSFLVTFALLAHVSVLASARSMLQNLFQTALAAQLAALPILLYHFYEISVWSIGLNVFFVPWYSFVILPIAFLSAVFSFSPLIWLFSRLIELTDAVVRFFSVDYSFMLVLGRPGPWCLAGYLTAIAAAFLDWERGRLIRGLTAVAAATALQLAAPYVDPKGEVTVLDVGQGDCIYIELPYRKAVYLIDTSGTPEWVREPWRKRSRPFAVGRDVVVPFLKAQGVRTLDQLILTHDDADHIGAAPEVMGAVRVKKIVTSPGALPAVKAMARPFSVPVAASVRGDRWKVGDAAFSVLHPEAGNNEDNNGSLVLLARLGRLTWLFAADIEEEAEQALIRAYPELRADVLKVAHHGSKTSTTELFLRTVKPRAAIISVGRYNRYGHPSPEVLMRLRQQRAIIWRTDENGAIRYVYDENGGTFQVMKP
ncbi:MULTISPECIES: DNA internalization-related competence protein ComEC/Rec2 [Geobacillus]|uniref:DNA internalization-related competence protein ComEC/Rec2 n=1 Tax=Geobacillus TaxID=129337 RepID=UPI0009C077DD|nr:MULTISPECIES: DNA internalization-related competence protein ComEC/Rec2 [Geobacillus thermoleovorans group]MED3666125.1 DNA internalization-related competence protein ComEC/Rec2 [Geobacillus kaustophilus]OQP13788.1 DNA internalization-related competence protein ComEC/Rec2 [Geobacillus thermoleovorans]QNU21136.1 DNA internalization-related competence protein ComEC/Rec2 [Geobacillus thermoleovorans]